MQEFATFFMNRVWIYTECNNEQLLDEITVGAIMSVKQQTQAPMLFRVPSLNLIGKVWRTRTKRPFSSFTFRSAKKLIPTQYVPAARLIGWSGNRCSWIPGPSAAQTRRTWGCSGRLQKTEHKFKLARMKKLRHHLHFLWRPEHSHRVPNPSF